MVGRRIRGGIMKYQEALERVKGTIKDLRDLKYEPYITDEDIEILQEAIDKAKQKHFAILSKHDVTYHCPNCKTRLDFSNVRILWTETEDKK